MTEITSLEKLSRVIEHWVYTYPRMPHDEVRTALSAIYENTTMNDPSLRIKALNEVAEIMDNLNDAGVHRTAYLLGVEFNLYALAPRRDHRSSCAIHLRMAHYLLEQDDQHAKAVLIMENALNDAKRLGDQYLIEQVAHRYKTIAAQSATPGEQPPAP